MSSSNLIVDYGMGNLFSIDRAINYVGCSALISGDPKVVAAADRIILPGVGAFGKAVEELNKRNLIEALKAVVNQGRPLLGICLGMQLLLTESHEFGIHKGLNLIPGTVRRFKEVSSPHEKWKIPQTGWNSIEVPEQINAASGPDASLWNGTVLQGLHGGDYVYFVHSYICVPEEQSCCIAETEYGGDRFCSVVALKNIYGCQFHPERSGEAGLAIYKNFLKM